MTEGDEASHLREQLRAALERVRELEARVRELELRLQAGGGK